MGATALAGVANAGAVVDEMVGTIRTTLKLSNRVITMTDATTAGCHGSIKLYDFPACNLLFLGATW